MERKSWTTAIILSVLLGGLGVDRFYLGYIGMGVLKLLSVGCFGILYIIDIVDIASKKLQPEDGLGYEEDYQSYQRQQMQGIYFQQQTQKNTSNLDDLVKYKELYDMGVLTEEEFKRKKEEILGL